MILHIPNQLWTFLLSLAELPTSRVIVKSQSSSFMTESSSAQTLNSVTSSKTSMNVSVAILLYLKLHIVPNWDTDPLHDIYH